MKNHPMEKNKSFDFLYDLIKRKAKIKRINNDAKTEKLNNEFSNFVECSIVRLRGKNKRAIYLTKTFDVVNKVPNKLP